MLVIKGKPGITNNIAPIYPASCCEETPKAKFKNLKKNKYDRQAAATLTEISANKVIFLVAINLRIKLPIPAPTKQQSISIGPPPNKNTKELQANAAAKAAWKIV